MLNQSTKSGDGSCQAATQETPSQKGSGKGSGAAPGAGAVVPKDPPPPPAPTVEKEKEATQPTDSENAGCPGQVKSPLLRGCGGIIWLCALACLPLQIWVDASLLAGCQTAPITVGAWSSCQTAMTFFRAPSPLAADVCTLACNAACASSDSQASCMHFNKDGPVRGSWVMNRTSTAGRETLHSKWHVPGNVLKKSSHLARRKYLHQGKQAGFCGYSSGMQAALPHVISHTPGLVGFLPLSHDSHYCPKELLLA